MPSYGPVDVTYCEMNIISMSSWTYVYIIQQQVIGIAAIYVQQIGDHLA